MEPGKSTRLATRIAMTEEAEAPLQHEIDGCAAIHVLENMRYSGPAAADELPADRAWEPLVPVCDVDRVLARSELGESTKSLRCAAIVDGGRRVVVSGAHGNMIWLNNIDKEDEDEVTATSIDQSHTVWQMTPLSENVLIEANGYRSGFTLRNWDADVELQSWADCTNDLWETAVSHDRQLVAAASASGTLYLFEPIVDERGTVQLVQLDSVAIGTDSHVRSCSFGYVEELGVVYLVAAHSTCVHAYDVTAKCLSFISKVQHTSSKGDPSTMWRTRVAPSGRFVVSAGADMIWLWSVHPFEEQFLVKRKALCMPEVRAVEFINGQSLIAGALNGQLAVWDGFLSLEMEDAGRVQVVPRRVSHIIGIAVDSNTIVVVGHNTIAIFSFEMSRAHRLAFLLALRSPESPAHKDFFACSKLYDPWLLRVILGHLCPRLDPKS